MCGIAGILRVHPSGIPPPPPELAIPESWLDILDDSIKHRGPDGQGRFRDRAVRADGSVVDVAFVHRRLSILDHAGGAQPMVSVRGRSALRADSSLGRSVLRTDSSPSHAAPNTPQPNFGSPSVGSESRPTNGPTKIFHGKPNDEVRYRPLDPVTTAGLVAVVFNGCIYNHRELRKELQAAGHVFESDHSDTEVLVHGWREWKWSMFGRLEGMYGLAVWDRSSGDVIFARDAFGEKPLYTDHAGNGSFSFCSAPPGLVQLRRFLPSAQSESPLLEDSLTRGWIQFGWNQTGPYQKIKSAYIGSASPLGRRPVEGELSDHNIWFEVLNPDRRDLTIEQVDAALRRAVHARLDADVPTGCFLSGGIDSALIARYASEVRPDISAFTVRMPAKEFDESEAAAVTARAIGLKHEVLDCDQSPATDLVAAIQQLGLPFGDSSLLPSLWVSRAARRAITVALSGDGGDELFMGYDRHRAMQLVATLERMPRMALRAIARLSPSTGPPKSRRARIARLLNAAAHLGFKDLLAIFPTELAGELGLLQHGRGRGAGEILHWGMLVRSNMSTPFEFWTTLVRRLEVAFYLPEDLLRKSDTASMSGALEVRAPFLDLGVAKPAINATLTSLMPHNQRKGLLRAVARKYFPAEIVDRPKQGFAIPIGEWFRSDYGGMKQLLLDHLNSAEPWGSPALGIDLNMKFVRQMLDEHMGTGKSGRVARDHSQRLYMLLVLSIWAKWLSALK